MMLMLLKAVHVLAVVLWIGGMAFAHFFLRPSLLVLEPPQRVKLMHAVLGRFFGAVLWAAALILASGLWIIGRVAKQAVQSGGSFSMPLDWTVMTVVGVLMIAIFGHIRFVLYRRLDRAVQAGDMPAGGVALAAIRQWVGVNLALGVALIAGVLLY
ncbi:MAG: CopD family protein [Rubrivivax sp.]|nr:CopD family protein [Rubrivivax sp.]MDP3614682.1 CopD family protein [Rubrivivax sp.]